MDRRAKASRSEGVALHLPLQPRQYRFGVGDRRLEELVARAKGVENHVAIGQQEVAVLARHAHGVGKHRQRIGFGEIGDRVEAAAFHEFVDQRVRLLRETLAQPRDDRRREHAVEHAARPVVQWRVGLQHQALRPPRRLFGEVGEAGAAARTEGLPVVEHPMDLGVARDRPDIVARQPHDGARLAQFLMRGKRALEELAAERIDLRRRRLFCLQGHDCLLAEPRSILGYYRLMADRSLQIRPIAGALGAEIAGVDLAGDLDDGTIAAIRRAWLDHLVIFFRGQALPPERFLAFARHFGEVVEYPFIQGIEGFPLITPVVKLEHERVNFGGLWHSDTAYLNRPPMGTMLIAREVPPYGGDTLFANMYLAYEALSPGMRRLLDGLVAVNSSAKADVTKTREDRLRDGAKPDARHEYVAEHPVVRTHPETGKKALYVNGGHTVRFRDISEEESAPLLNYLFTHQQSPEFTCRFRWEVGSLAFWDNRCAQHNPINDYHGWRRVMHRVTLAGDQPR